MADAVVTANSTESDSSAETACCFSGCARCISVTRQHDNSVMLALMLDAQSAERLALDIDGALPADQLHITLAYLGEMAAIKQGKRVLSAVAMDFVERFSPVVGTVSGVGRFNSEGDNPDPFYLSFDSPQLPDFRQTLIHWLELTGFNPILNHGYTPHITLAYLPSSADSPLSTIEPTQLTFNAVTLMWGTERIDFPLTLEASSDPLAQRAVLTSSEGDVSTPTSDVGERKTEAGTGQKERAMGKLASTLSDAVDKKVSDDMPRSEVIAMMADAAGIESGTVNDILSGDITCPPMNRLEGFADALDVSLSSLVSAAEDGGCEYEQRDRNWVMRKVTQLVDLILPATEVADRLQDTTLAMRSQRDVTKSRLDRSLRDAGLSDEAVASVLEALGSFDESELAEFAATTAGASDSDESGDVSAERGLSMWDIDEMVWSAFMEMSRESGSLYRLHEIVHEVDGMYAIVLHEGNAYRAQVTVIGDTELHLGELQRSEPTTPVREQSPTARSVFVQRMEDGSAHLAIIAATPFLNRSGEIDSIDLFKSFEEYATTNNHLPVIDFYHKNDILRIGQAYSVSVVDEFSYVALARIDDTPFARSMTAALESEPEFWGASIEYRATQMPDFEEVAPGVHVAVYRSGINDYISILPEDHAANLLTATAVRREAKDDNTMAMTSREYDAFLKAAANMDDDKRNALISQIQGVAEVGRSGGKIFRSQEADETNDTKTETPDEPEPTEPTEPEATPDAGANGDDAPLTRGALAELLAPIGDALKTLAESDKATKERLDALASANEQLTADLDAEKNRSTKREADALAEAADVSARIANEQSPFFVPSKARGAASGSEGGEQEPQKPASSLDLLKRTQQQMSGEGSDD